MIPHQARSYGVDVARGYCLVIMTIDHLPRNILGRFSNVQFGPFGFFTGASGFVFISGLVSAWVYGSVLREQGFGAAMRRALRRIGTLYLVNTALFLLVFAGVRLQVLTGPEWQSEFALFFTQPWTALWKGVLLIYRPGYLDILPMFMLFLLLLTPALVAIQAGYAWGVVLASAAVWLWVQASPPPFSNSLNPLAYQVLFALGLVIGSVDQVEARLRSPAMIRLAQASLALAAVLFAFRFGLGLLRTQEANLPSWRRLVDLENNGPLRLANFALFSLACVFLWQRLSPRVRTGPFPRWLAYLGQHSLWVFSWSVLLTYVSLSLMPASPSPAWRLLDLTLTVLSLVIPVKLFERLRPAARS